MPCRFAAEQEVAAELAVLRDQAGIVGAALQARQALIGRQLVECRIALQLECEAAERAAMVIDVALPKLAVGTRRSCVDHARRLRGVVLVPEVGGNRDQDRGRVGVRQGEMVADAL